jgi:E3 ubiquitin-protein ligase TRIP12
MVKARAKADRAATRLAVQAPAANGTLPTTSTPEDAALAPSQDTISQDAEENMESSAVLPNIDAVSSPSRTELLRSKSVVVSRFMQLLVPILVDVYAASVSAPIRMKTLTGILKTVSFLEGEGLKQVFMVRCIHI